MDFFISRIPNKHEHKFSDTHSLYFLSKPNSSLTCGAPRPLLTMSIYCEFPSVSFKTIWIKHMNHIIIAFFVFKYANSFIRWQKRTIKTQSGFRSMSKKQNEWIMVKSRISKALKALANALCVLFHQTQFLYHLCVKYFFLINLQYR